VTIISTSAARRRLDPADRHAYTLPVVRELPSQPPDPNEASTW
jgi:hypothetical protein